MKKFGLILAGCLAFTGLCGAHADDIGDAARAASRHDANITTISARQRTDSPAQQTTARLSSNKTSNIVTRNTTARTATVVNRSSEPTGAIKANVVARTTATPRTKTNTPTLTTRVAKNTSARTTATRGPVRTATRIATREDILNRNYSKCKEIFNECMDEFCANKDAQLKRCACSSRIHEFDKIKKQLSNVDEKMLDFNQRLLTVSMDEKDVAAINTATEGEKAFYDTKDKSESKKTLDAIAKKLNISFDSNKFSSGIGNTLSWSLDIDSAFDNVDYLRGASTAAKSGTALYSAALPICREMAAEVCSAEDLILAENGYMVLVEQACDTVEKTYKTAAQQARTKVLESSALLDMSRLDVYQKNNADDILTCKKKMLNMLTNSTVCGDNLGKCLDITGEYIDPSTGEAFINSELSNLATLITRPTADNTWTSEPNNASFVSFLNSKKKFLEPAMENCQDISDIVWNAFVEDALSQIKIAQMRKLEDVRQSCTALTAQCLSGAIDSIEAFDARALSIFGVAADMTANAMCDSILSSCTALLNNVQLLNETTPNNEWNTGMTSIQTDITYNTIKQTCREVGRACIIQVCTSTSGNFGLCENIDTSINRKSIINHEACWGEVVQCVKSAGPTALERIFSQNHLDTISEDSDWYQNIYPVDYPFIRPNDDPEKTQRCIGGVKKTEETAPGETELEENKPVPYCVYDMCYDECGGLAYKDSYDCRACRIAESIWGNCEVTPTQSLNLEKSHNRIQKPKDGTTTLLYWFAKNTNTDDSTVYYDESCRDTTCGIGFVNLWDDTTKTIICWPIEQMTDDGLVCGGNSTKINITNSITNCCTSGVKDSNDNCCKSGETTTNGNLCIPANATPVAQFTIRTPTSYYPAGTYKLFCIGTLTADQSNNVTCSGRYVIVKTDATIYMDPQYDGDTQPEPQTKETIAINGKTYTYTWSPDNGWSWGTTDEIGESEIQNWMVNF